MKISLIVVTYQWPQGLECVLASVAQQLVMPLEVIVADDGSGSETRERVTAWSKQLPIPLRHVWQEDRGFRAGAARNRAAAVAKGDYLVFLDGDCLVFPDFIRRHTRLAETDWFVVGNRLLLTRKMSEQVIEGNINPLHWHCGQWVKARLQKQVNRLGPLLRLGDGVWRKWQSKKRRGAQSCNLALWKNDFLNINGFDERFQGWGHEDADLVVRLIANGCYRKDGRYAVPVVHLWHPQQSRELEQGNKAQLEARLRGESEIFARCGVDQYVSAKPDR